MSSLFGGPELVVLGVAQDAGVPHAGCRRDCCAPSWEDPSFRRLPACLGLLDRRTGARWLVEATPELPLQLHRLLETADPDQERPRSVLDGVFLTHAHIGHYLGLAQLGRESLGTRGIPVHVLPRLERFLRENGPWSQLVDLGNIALHPIAPAVPVKLSDDLSVTPILVPHRGEFSETVAFRIRGPRRAALFLPDIDAWETWDHALEDEIAEVDIAYLDATFFDESELPGRSRGEIPHPLVRETMDRLDGTTPELRARVRFLHFNHTNPLLRPGAAREEVRRRGYLWAEEGDTLDL